MQKFLSRKIHVDEVAQTEEILARSTFAEHLIDARLAFITSAIYCLLTFSLPQIGVSWPLGLMFLYIAVMNVLSFMVSILVSPPHARHAVIVAFVLAVTMSFAAGGYGTAKTALQKGDAIRDDHIVVITRTNGQFSIAVEPIFAWPPQLKKLLLQWVGSQGGSK